MYKLCIECGKISLNLSFKTLDERDDFIAENYDPEWDWLVPCSFGGWIDIRDGH